MHVQEIVFAVKHDHSREMISDIAERYLSALRMNGQICGSEWPLYIDGSRCSAFVNTPEANSLDEAHASKFVLAAASNALENGVSISQQLRKDSLDGAPLCNCQKKYGYILFTTYVSLESPIRCVTCFGTIPLYRLPMLPSGEFYEVICWQSDYQSCDSLQMNCNVLERAATDELSSLRSNLSKAGRSICRKLEQLTGKPFYYYLYRGEGRSAKLEQQRRCPGCNDRWYMDNELHERFSFRCDRCRLLSNAAWNLS